MAETDDSHRVVGSEHTYSNNKHTTPWSLFRHYLCVLSAALVSMIGLAVIVGWHTKTDALIQVHPDLAPTPYNAALCFIACGLALFLTNSNQRRLSRLIATATLIFSSLTLLQHLLGNNILAIDHLTVEPYLNTRTSTPWRMSVFTCATFILSSAALIWSGRQKPRRNTQAITATFSTVAIAISLPATIGYAAGLTHASSLSHITQMSLLTVIGFIILGVGTLTRAWSDHNQAYQQAPIWLPRAIFASTLTTTILLCSVIYEKEAYSIERTATAKARVITTILSAELADRHASIGRMAQRYSQLETPLSSIWLNSAKQNIFDETDYQLIALTDTNLNPIWIAADPEFNEPFPSSFLPKGWSPAKLLHHVNRLSGVATILSSPEANQIKIVAAIYNDDRFNGFIVATIDSKKFFKNLLPNNVTTGHHFRVTSGSRLLFQCGKSSPPAVREWCAIERFSLHGAQWTVTAWPDPHALKVEHTFYSKGVLGLGILVSSLLGLTCYLLQITYRKSQEAATHNASLQHEIHEHIRSREELEKASALNDAIVTHSAYAVITTDTDGIITSFNPAAERMLGYDAAELIGIHTPALFHDLAEVAARATELSKKYNASIGPGFNAFVHEAHLGIDGRREWTYIHKNGSRIPVSLATTSIINSLGKIVGFVGVSNNISELKETMTALKNTHQKLMDTSLQVGRAEVATNILHNVGNVLNSINITSTILGNRIRDSRISSLNKTADLLDQQAGTLSDFISTDRRGQQLPAFIRKMANRLAYEQQQSIDDISQLTRDINHLRDIIAAQQSHAKVSNTCEFVPVTELIATALKIQTPSIQGSTILISIDCEPSEIVYVEHHKAVQILINLISNSKHACQHSESSSPKITITVRSDEQQCRITITDNGYGIPQENINRIFNHGFTTNNHGHGFGLHSSALAAAEMKGSLHASSAGPGMGASFILSLPTHPNHESS